MAWPRAARLASSASSARLSAIQFSARGGRRPRAVPVPASRRRACSSSRSKSQFSRGADLQDLGALGAGPGQDRPGMGVEIRGGQQDHLAHHGRGQRAERRERDPPAQGMAHQLDRARGVARMEPRDELRKVRAHRLGLGESLGEGAARVPADGQAEPRVVGIVAKPQRGGPGKLPPGPFAPARRGRIEAVMGVGGAAQGRVAKPVDQEHDRVGRPARRRRPAQPPVEPGLADRKSVV